MSNKEKCTSLINFSCRHGETFFITSNERVVFLEFKWLKKIGVTPAIKTD